jgi:hypothetical protein
MLVNIKVTVTNSETNEVISEKTVEKLQNHFVRSDKKIDANYVKCYFMSHNNKKEANFRQFDEIQSLSVNLNNNAVAVKTIDSDTVTSEQAKTQEIVTLNNVKALVDLAKIDNSEAKTEIKKILSKKQAKKALAQLKASAK